MNVTMVRWRAGERIQLESNLNHVCIKLCLQVNISIIYNFVYKLRKHSLDMVFLYTVLQTAVSVFIEFEFHTSTFTKFIEIFLHIR